MGEDYHMLASFVNCRLTSSALGSPVAAVLCLMYYDACMQEVDRLTKSFIEIYLFLSANSASMNVTIDVS
jgi:hypothetical protein